MITGTYLLLVLKNESLICNKSSNSCSLTQENFITKTTKEKFNIKISDIKEATLDIDSYGEENSRATYNFTLIMNNNNIKIFSPPTTTSYVINKDRKQRFNNFINGYYRKLNLTDNKVTTRIMGIIIFIVSFVTFIFMKKLINKKP
jgi:hypothetical protein